MKYVVISFFCLLYFFFNLNIATAHGVRGWTQTREAIMVESEYDDGEPISYAVFEIYYPEGKDLFQSGVTDPNGRFFFLPDTPGKWKIIIKDGMGHQVSLTADINSQQALITETETSPASSPRHLSGIQSVITGISFIFGLTGLGLLLKSRKRHPET